MQVIRLCEAHQLLSALVYIYNRMNDFRCVAVCSDARELWV